MAEELAFYAAKRLKPGSLPDKLAGAEDDIRQEGILLALRWYNKHRIESDGTTLLGPWNAQKSVAVAMRYVKWRFLSKQNTFPPTLSIHNIPEELLTLERPINPHMSAWSADTMRIVASKGLVTALKAGSISHANAAVARLVLLEGMSAPDAASELGITRSAVYQHLNRVKRSLRPLIDEIEVSYLE